MNKHHLASPGKPSQADQGEMLLHLTKKMKSQATLCKKSNESAAKVQLDGLSSS